MTPYYQDDFVTLFHGDCIEVLPSLSGVDLVFTSPPYNLGTHPTAKKSGMHAGSGYTANGKTWNRVADLAGGYGKHDDAMPHADYDEWQTTFVHLAWQSLSDEGAIFYNHKPRPFGGELKLPLVYGHDLPLRQIIVWDRGVGMNFSTSHFLPKSEWICVWAKPAWQLTDKSASAVGDVWRVRPEDATDHPAPFPYELPRRAISATGASVVLDPFAGSGTTLRAAKNLGRRAVGIELEERYCELAAARCSQDVFDFGGVA
jgi:DNA modification methylase